jgi:DnaJ-class molecular chaperone
MNFKEAIDILELPENYSIDILKKNYKRLAVKYHPDKYSGDSSKFIKINDSYNFLLKRMNGNEDISINNIIADFLKNFNNIQFIKIHTIPIFPIIPNQNILNPECSEYSKYSEYSDNITILEYLSGFTRKYSSTQECPCEPLYCVECLGLGLVNFNTICSTNNRTTN